MYQKKFMRRGPLLLALTLLSGLLITAVQGQIFGGEASLWQPVGWGLMAAAALWAAYLRFEGLPAVIWRVLLVFYAVLFSAVLKQYYWGPTAALTDVLMVLTLCCVVMAQAICCLFIVMPSSSRAPDQMLFQTSIGQTAVWVVGVGLCLLPPSRGEIGPYLMLFSVVALAGGLRMLFPVLHLMMPAGLTEQLTSPYRRRGAGLLAMLVCAALAWSWFF